MEKSGSNDPAEREKSIIFQHERDNHEGKKVKWNMKVVKSFNKRGLDRFIYESIRIAQRPSETSLNSKMEYAQSGLITVCFESELTKKKNEKLLIKEALKTKDDTGNQMLKNNPQNSNNTVKSKVLEIERKIQMEKENNSKNNIKKYVNKKKDEKWPPPQDQGGGGMGGL